ncbi:P-ATPase superfamily P-type ATPase cation transporter, partial [Shouchella clausii]
LRDGEWKKIPSREVAVGDLLKFSTGDRVGADVRIVESNSLEIEESALTGESLPVQKRTGSLKTPNLAIGDMENMAFMGT